MRKKFSIKSGFTSIEFVLACAFISVFIILVAIIIRSVTVVYQRGLTLKSVNSTGEDIIDELSRAITSAPLFSNPRNLCNYLSDGGLRSACQSGTEPGYKLIYQNYSIPANSVVMKKKNANYPIGDSVSIGGVFCTGEYSYIWNTGYVLNKEIYTSTYDPISVNIDSSSIQPRLLRVKDSGRQVCAYNIEHSGSYAHPTFNDITLSSIESDDVSDLLAASEDNLALYDLRIFYPVYHATTKQGFYSGTFILGTLTGGVDVTSSEDFCSDAPEFSFSSDFPYCAINKFNFASRATGEE